MRMVLVMAAFAVVAGSAGRAQDAAAEFSAGAEEYQTACAACHGADADGKGDLAAMFKVPIPDLTGLAARNDGVFPTLKVIQTIDGRAVVRGHGNPMPLFGRRFDSELGDTVGAYGTEQIVRGRVLELALYLQSIQK